MSILGCTVGGIAAWIGRIIYSPPYWDDLRVPATATNQGPANRPDFIQWGPSSGIDELYAWHFAPNIQEDLYFEAQFPHSYKEGTTWQPHVHWSPIDTNGGDVVWRLTYRWAAVNDVYTAIAGISVTASADGVTDKHQVIGLPDIPAPGAKISTMLTGRISRIGNDGADTYTSDAVLHEVDFHFQVNTPGSKQPFIK